MIFHNKEVVLVPAYHVDHEVLATHARNKVNVSADDAAKRRTQVNHLRSRLEAHIAAHPDYGLVKLRASGSTAKHTAIRRVPYKRPPFRPAPAAVERKALDWKTFVDRWRERVKRGHCPYCNYDLRESRDRCPECGRMVPSAVDEWLGRR